MDRSAAEGFYLFQEAFRRLRHDVVFFPFWTAAVKAVPAFGRAEVIRYESAGVKMLDVKPVIHISFKVIKFSPKMNLKFALFLIYTDSA